MSTPSAGKEERHRCVMTSPIYSLYGEAITESSTTKDGCIWVSNGEYASQVNFCPMCGKKASKSIDFAQGQDAKSFSTLNGVRVDMED